MSLGGDDGYGGDYEGHEPRRGRGAASEGHLTRTRLPEGDGDPYGPPRRAPGRAGKPSRNLITVVGVVVLLLAAIAFVNRGGQKDDSSSGGDSGGGTGTEARPTAPTGERPVDGKNNTTGIASGFAKSEQGAQSAAANYAVALASADMANSDRRHQLVSKIFASDRVSGLQEKLDRAYSKSFLAKLGLDADGNAPAGMTYVSRAAPIGTKTTTSTDTAATVEVWCTGVFGTAGEGSKNPVANDWFTVTVKLRWVNKDWKVESYSQKDGPAPVNSDNTASTADEIAKAVQQYGGFTYAR
ncbi:hypothetical protein GCM10009548_81270 [Streptomyces malaysiensis subsp. malaysiensis]|uniref:DUF8175 domain-containing protein n=1 Tax=Streptomyces malaysiensis TaxID=92644 RepID=A0ABX6W9J3_STRMQ|nr:MULTISPECIES: hypothetical protein [Streptomyces]QPI57728.1 hypothetical protein I1A49_25005 [Streptomyces solisilvae]UHH19288.1 hypothetical protein LUV23_25190 [Streptomyces sp. HNM0561]